MSALNTLLSIAVSIPLLLTPGVTRASNNPVYFQVGNGGEAVGRIIATKYSAAAGAETQYLAPSNVSVRISAAFICSSTGEVGSKQASGSTSSGYASTAVSLPDGAYWTYISGIHTADRDGDHGSDISFLDLVGNS